MKFENQDNFKVAARLLVVLALAVGFSDRLPAEGAIAPGVADVDPPVARTAAPIPVDKIGAVAQKQYAGDGLVVAATHDGAELRCIFQRINARATAEGLWVTSTVDSITGESFRVMARMLGRSNGEILASSGTVEVADKLVRLIRPGLVEEYSVSMDGVQQDFIIAERPAGEGQLRVELAVEGAKVEQLGEGALLALTDGGRKIAFNRLNVVDAAGKKLAARIEVTSGTRMALLVADDEATYPVRIDPTFSDVNWISMGGPLGADDKVYAAVVDDSGNLYIGGIFRVAGVVLADHVAKWDGHAWSALGSGVNGPVLALAVSGSNIYAGGQFITTAGGNSVTNVAKWNGSAWSALGSGVDASVLALAVSGSNLYAGGNFTNAGGNSANRVAKWNGSAWSALGSGVNNYVRALAVSGSDLFVGGGFTAAGDNSVTNVAKWNGNAWSALGSGVNDSVLALAVSGSDLYAGGNFTTAGGNSANRVAKWNGSTWSALGSGVNGLVDALAVSGSSLFVGGYFTTAGGSSATDVAKWNGNAWSALGSGLNDSVRALAVSGSDLYVGGDFTVAGGNGASYVAKWNGSAWSALGSALAAGVNNYVQALAVSGSDLYVGGDFTMSGENDANLVAKWSGSAWSALGSGVGKWGGFPGVRAMAVSGSDLYVGGVFTRAGDHSANQVAKWNGNAWSALGSGVSGGSYPSADALAVSGSDLYVGGAFTMAGGNNANHVAKWDGSVWSALGSGVNGYVYALAVSGSDLYVAGDFTTAGGNSANHVAKWNGNAWSALGSGLNDSVRALVVSGTDLYAGGYFTMSGGNSANLVAKWDGSAWSALGSGVSGGSHQPVVRAMAMSGSSLYVGGDFTTADGSSANCVAEWDGSAWSALGSGLGIGSDINGYYMVNTLTALGSDLYVGGSFTTAGGKGSPFMAKARLDGIMTSIGSLGCSNGLFGFNISGSAGQALVVEGSTNLRNWTPLQTNAPGGASYFSDPQWTNYPGRFYRLRSP